MICMVLLTWRFGVENEEKKVFVLVFYKVPKWGLVGVLV